LIYNNGSESKLDFEYLCESYGIRRTPTTIKNPQANAIPEHLHQVLTQMLRTAELNMAKSVTSDDINVFLDNAAWAICSTYHTVLKASPGAAIFRRDMLFGIPFIANWNKIGDYRQRQTNLNTAHKNSTQVDYDYKVEDKVQLRQDSILRKAESPYRKKTWTVTTFHMNGTIRIQCKTKSEQLHNSESNPIYRRIK
jgi:hypothetical protein